MQTRKSLLWMALLCGAAGGVSLLLPDRVPSGVTLFLLGLAFAATISLIVGSSAATGVERGDSLPKKLAGGDEWQRYTLDTLLSRSQLRTGLGSGWLVIFSAPGVAERKVAVFKATIEVFWDNKRQVVFCPFGEEIAVTVGDVYAVDFKPAAPQRLREEMRRRKDGQ